jgi:hypothetical protein
MSARASSTIELVTSSYFSSSTIELLVDPSARIAYSVILNVNRVPSTPAVNRY